MSKAFADAPGAPLERDRTDPSIADVLRFDPTLPFSQEARKLASRDLCRWSHRALLPLAVGELQIESRTSTIDLLVPFCFRSSCQRVLQRVTNFGSGALVR